jgi:short-subunit dehydrogenase
MKPAENLPVFTLITGGSTGLGRELAIAYARRHTNLILVALPGRNLQQLCNELELMFGIRAISIECDLANETALEEMAAYVKQNFSVNQLVNNAGIGGTLRFTEATRESLDKIIHLNIRATTMLTHFMLPELMLHPRALILNIASMAAFGPVPYKTITPASKAFIYSFSRSLSRELKGTGVRVVVANPARMITNPEVTFGIIKQGIWGKIGFLTTGRVADLVLSGVESGKEVIVPGCINKLNRLFTKWLPESLMLTLLERALRKELPIRDLFSNH